MNKPQRIVLCSAAAVFVLCGLFPPWVGVNNDGSRFQFLFNPPHQRFWPPPVQMPATVAAGESPAPPLPRGTEASDSAKGGPPHFDLGSLTPEQRLLAMRRQAELAAPPSPVPAVEPPSTAPVPPLLPQQRLPPISQQALPGAAAPAPAPQKPAYQDIGDTIQNNLYMALRKGDKAGVKYFQQTMVDNERNKLLSQGLPFEQADFRARTRYGEHPKPPAGFTLAPGATRFDATGKVIANVPPEPKPSAPFTLPPGATRYEANGNPIVTNPKPATPPKEPPQPRLDTSILGVERMCVLAVASAAWVMVSRPRDKEQTGA